MAFFNRSGMNWGMMLLALYLVLSGVSGLVNMRFMGKELLMNGLAIAAGVLIFLRK